ncbi:hypothetical protein SAMN04487909_10893 [Aneurinibacillus migulanus]|uniref:Uncharacterized protein n=1 Tax=Aneurinibacillus migulanus TaxID=47500 RepID=A0A1G8NS71_ANEMI|nr:hypothetical protein SAMN04487909_10893 [Aneurinibacillus migulanus]
MTKKQAEIIESIKDGTDDIANFLTHWHTAQDKAMVATRENFTPSLLMKAWEYGYEIEKTPEERALDYYETLEHLMNEAAAKDNRGKAVALSNERVGARNILIMLGIKIEGINA